MVAATTGGSNRPTGSHTNRSCDFACDTRTVEITIVKAEAGPHRAVVARPGAEAVQFAVYDYGPTLPHDLVHYVVEDELGLEFGFWGLVSAGANLQSVQAYGARDPRRIPPQTDPLVTAHIDELLAAEGVVATFSGLPGTHPEPELEPAVIERIRARMTELNQRWQATVPGEALRLRWPGHHRNPTDEHR
jgi:hypothetical protein